MRKTPGHNGNGGSGGNGRHHHLRKQSTKKTRKRFDRMPSLEELRKRQGETAEGTLAHFRGLDYDDAA